MVPSDGGIRDRIPTEALALPDSPIQDPMALVLDVHAPYGPRLASRDTPGLGFFADLRRNRITLPVVLLTWHETEYLRDLCREKCPHLYVRYRDGKAGEEQGSYAFRRYPTHPVEIAQTLQRMRAMSAAELDEIERLLIQMIHAHP